MDGKTHTYTAGTSLVAVPPAPLFPYLYLDRTSGSCGPYSVLLILAEEWASTSYTDTRKHMLCTEWHPSCEPPLGRVGAHQSDDCVAISGPASSGCFTSLG
ncbi:Transforming Growth Factor Beta-1-Induced Transcript 1 Protein [Manis pentadactyla]|nr:Transforming Growth Factor Beta-1-Induced Transcript 1 Protein [Manis pentadactyla]